MLILPIKKRHDLVKMRNHFEKNTSTKNLNIFIARTPKTTLELSNKKRATDFARFGVVVTKKIDKRAVVRNKIKRRIREAFRISSKQQINTGYDYQIIAKSEILKTNFNEIIGDIKNNIKT